MRCFKGLLLTFALSVALAACGDEGAGCDEPIADTTGTWQINSMVVSDDCEGREDFMYQMVIVQNGSAVTGETDDFGTFSGTICGDQMQLNGSFPQDAGTVTAKATLTVLADGGSMQGSDNWTWTDGFESCSGSDSLTGTRL